MTLLFTRWAVGHGAFAPENNAGSDNVMHREAFGHSGFVFTYFHVKLTPDVNNQDQK